MRQVHVRRLMAGEVGLPRPRCLGQGGSLGRDKSGDRPSFAGAAGERTGGVGVGGGGGRWAVGGARPKAALVGACPGSNSCAAERQACDAAERQPCNSRGAAPHTAKAGRRSSVGAPGRRSQGSTARVATRPRRHRRRSVFFALPAKVVFQRRRPHSGAEPLSACPPGCRCGAAPRIASAPGPRGPLGHVRTRDARRRRQLGHSGPPAVPRRIMPSVWMGLGRRCGRGRSAVRRVLAAVCPAGPSPALARRAGVRPLRPTPCRGHCASAARSPWRAVRMYSAQKTSLSDLPRVTSLLMCVDLARNMSCEACVPMPWRALRSDIYSLRQVRRSLQPRRAIVCARVDICQTCHRLVGDSAVVVDLVFLRAIWARRPSPSPAACLSCACTLPWGARPGRRAGVPPSSGTLAWVSQPGACAACCARLAFAGRRAPCAALTPASAAALERRPSATSHPPCAPAPPWGRRPGPPPSAPRWSGARPLVRGADGARLSSGPAVEGGAPMLLRFRGDRRPS